MKERGVKKRQKELSRFGQLLVDWKVLAPQNCRFILLIFPLAVCSSSLHENCVIYWLSSM